MQETGASKIKHLKIWDILNRETDEEHPMKTPDLIARLEECGIHCDHRTLYRNIEELNENGYEVMVKRGSRQTQGLNSKRLIFGRVFGIINKNRDEKKKCCLAKLILKKHSHL